MKLPDNTNHGHENVLRPKSGSLFWMPTWKSPGTIIYDKNCKLSSNSTSKTYKGKFDDLDIVVKRYKLSSCLSSAETSFLKDLENLPKHPNVSQILHTLVSPTHFLIATELYSHSLQHCVETKDYLIEKLGILRQITTGLDFLHKNQVVHMNVKPSNVLICANANKSDAVKLTCYGIPHTIYNRNTCLARVMSTQGFCWTAPEILGDMLSEKDDRIPWTPQMDIFSLGCLFYYVLSDGLHPFGDTVRCGRNVMDGKSSVKAVPRYNRSIIKRMIHKTPNKRPCADIIMASLTSSNPAPMTLCKSYAYIKSGQYQDESNPRAAHVLCMQMKEVGVQ